MAFDAKFNTFHLQTWSRKLILESMITEGSK